MSKKQIPLPSAIRYFAILKILLDDNEEFTRIGYIEMFGMTDRSFYRDMNVIRNLGIPIKERYGRYKIDLLEWKKLN